MHLSICAKTVLILSFLPLSPPQSLFSPSSLLPSFPPTPYISPLPSLPPKIFPSHHSIAQQSNFNLMKASNLGVVFGPTLMRAEVETVATIVDIKYQNIIVQEMIEQKSRVCGLCLHIVEYV